MTLDTQFAAGMREQLIETAAGTSPLAKRTHRHRVALGVAFGAGAVALLTAGAVVVASVLPGAQIVDAIGPAVTQSYVGSSRVDIGEVADGANAVQITIECTSPGAFDVSYLAEDGMAIGTLWVCGDGEVPVGTRTPMGVLTLVDGQVDVQVSTDAETTWIASVQFVAAETTEWGVNANGQTYGVPNNNGEPDLYAVYASNCEIGYIYSNHLSPADPDGQLAIPVYKSDGVTVIGEFWIGNDVPFCDQH
jgi:hypothetical protein